MPNCIVCGSYTKFPNGKCTDCYYKNGKEKQSNAFVEPEETGMDDREWQYRYGMIKGRIAETLIEELFLTLKFNVFRYGMENSIPGIMDLLKGVRSDVANHIRRMPDLVVQRPKTNQVYFVEVKFRANGCFSNEDLPKDYPYHNAFIILVSKRHIKCLSVAELQQGKEMTPDCRNYLGNRKEFELDKEVIREFCDFALQFFAEV
jgi:hypothetical protein